MDFSTNSAPSDYPEQFMTQHVLSDGTTLSIRPVRLQDVKIIKDFSRNLSHELKHLNYMESFKELPEHMVKKLTEVDYQKTMTLIATYKEHDKEIVVGMVYYIIDKDHQCDFDMIVTDAWQQHGVGNLLTEALIQTASRLGAKKLQIMILASNIGGMMLAKHFGFVVNSSDEPTVKAVTKDL